MTTSRVPSRTAQTVAPKRPTPKPATPKHAPAVARAAVPAAVAPKPATAQPAPKPATKPAGTACNPNYTPCVPNDPVDVDCQGGSGNGPSYVTGPVTVVGKDVYGLDADHDGIGCE